MNLMPADTKKCKESIEEITIQNTPTTLHSQQITPPNIGADRLSVTNKPKLVATTTEVQAAMANTRGLSLFTDSIPFQFTKAAAEVHPK